MIQQAARRHEAEPAEGVRLGIALAGRPVAGVTVGEGNVKAIRSRGAERDLGEIDGEILREGRVGHDGLDGGIELAALKGGPVDLAEEAVFLDGRQVLGHVVAEALGRVLAQQADEKVFGVRAEEVGQDELLLRDLLLQLGVVVRAEGRRARQEIEAQSAK